MQPSHPQQSRPSSESPVVPRRKSPAPSFINLNDCKPILHSTFTNTSTNSSNHGSKAFVFTSSRTLRALQQQEDYGFHQLSPSSSIASSPATPPTPSSTSSNGRHRAQLTLSQLTKHSEGAIDARSLIGPKMREAGFVNLPHTMSSRSDLGTPGTPASPSSPPSSSASSSSFPVSVLFHPTPSNPPIFPPIVFLNPTLLTASSMWEYQRDPRWSFSTATGRSTHASAQQHPPATSSNEATPAASDPSTSGFFPPVAAHPPRRVGMPASSGSSSSDSSGLLSSSGSSSTLVSTDSSPSTGLSSVEETDEDEGKALGTKGKAKALVLEPSEYPFPPTYDHPLPARSRGSRGSRGSRASSATASPKTIIYAGPALPSHDRPPTPLNLSVDRSSSSSPRQGTRDPRVEKQPPSPRSRRLSGERLDKHKPQKALVESTPTFATARRPAYQRQYSLTELCDSSPYVWLTKSDIFMPPAPISRSPIRTPSMAPSMSVSFSRPRAVVDPPPPHRRHHTAPDNVPTLHPERHHRIVSAPLRLSAGTSDGNSSDHDREKASSKRANKTRASAEHVADSSAAVGSPADAHSGDEIAVRGGSRDRERGRDPRGKLLGASQAVRERAAAERAESAVENAKDGLAALMLAHRKRDQEYARHVAADRARDKLVKQKQRAHHKLRGRFAQEYEPSESETTMVDHQAFSSKPNKSDVAAVAHLVPVVKSVD